VAAVSTTQLAVAARDEVSAAIAALFGYMRTSAHICAGLRVLGELLP
jgi:ABC-type transporter Mla maintaining outer membrane lipid asymmetry permease subunit MlaE